MKKKLQAAVKEAMRAKDKVRLSTIRGALAALQYEEMRKSKDELSNDESIAVLASEVKKRDEALEYAVQDGRAELQTELQAERAILFEFLPEQLDAARLTAIIQGLKQAEPGIALGAVMKKLREDYNGRFDGKLASEVAKKVLVP